MARESKQLMLNGHDPKTPKLHLVKGGNSCGPDVGVQSNEISELVGSPHPKEQTLSFSEITESEKSPEHLQAIEDVGLLVVGLIKAAELNKRHLKTYKNWDGMTQRCKADPETGIRPIVLHPSFENFADFLRIAGPRPYPTWSVDRIDPTGPYSPDNCRWASKKTQSRNRTNTVYMTARGVTQPLVAWADELGINPGTLRRRRRDGWTDEEIIDGKKSWASNSPLLPISSQKHWEYTPWPFKYREKLEAMYQRFRHSGEHRLNFMRRYSSERIGAISNSAESAAWPDYYTPTPKEEEFAQKLARDYDSWGCIFRDAQQKLAGDYQRQLYGLDSLPSRVEKRLSSAVSPA